MATKGKSRKTDTDAIAMLKADHAKVKKMFKQFEQLHESEDADEAELVAHQICTELKIHTSVEEEIFYPAVRAAIDEEDLMDEADVEHQSAKDLIEQIESEGPSGDKYAAKVMVLGEYINHHVAEEQNEMFPKAKRAKLDMNELGERILARKQELKAEIGIMDEENEEQTPARAGRNRRSTRSGSHR